MYPDLDDVKREKKRIIGAVTPSDELLREVRMLHVFFKTANSVYDGRHAWFPAVRIKQMAEQFVGEVSFDGFLVAVLVPGEQRTIDQIPKDIMEKLMVKVRKEKAAA